MTEAYRYNTVLRCPVCQRDIRHIWHPTEPFNGDWRCLACEEASKIGEALADLAKIKPADLHKK